MHSSWEHQTVALGTVLLGTVMPGTVLPGTVLSGTVLLGAVLTGTVLPGTGEQDIGGGPGTAEPDIAKKLGTEESCTDAPDIQTHGLYSTAGELQTTGWIAQSHPEINYKGNKRTYL
jgi:hypothetical protein